MFRITKIMLCALVLVAVVGCGGGQPEPASTSTPAPTATPTPAPTATPTLLPTPTLSPIPSATPTPTPIPIPTPTPPVLTATPSSVSKDIGQDSGTKSEEIDAELVLSNSAEAMSEVGSFAFAVTGHLLVDSADGEVRIPLTYGGVSEAPGRSRGSLILNVFFFSLQIDLVIIGDTVWTTNQQVEVWEEAPSDSIALPNPALLIGGDTPALSDPVTVGTEQVDGVETIHLRGVPQIDALSGLGEELAGADVWVGVEDLLVYRIVAGGEIDLDSLGLPLASAGLTGSAELSVDIRLSDFGTPVEIEPPSEGQRRRQ